MPYMKKRESLIILPEIWNAGGDLSKKWLVIYSYRNPRTGKMERFRESQGINKFHTLEERTKAAEALSDELTQKLKTGWSPFVDTKIVYTDNLEYQTAVKNYRQIKATNGTFRFYSSKFLDSIKYTVEDSTLSTYRSKLRMFAAWLESRNFHELDISVIDQPLIVEFFNHLIIENALSKTSVDNYRQILIKAFHFIGKQPDRKTLINPCYDLPTTKRINDHTPQPIHEIDILPFLTEIGARDQQLLLAVSFQYYCYLRPGKELRLLQIGDIDFGRGRIRVKAITAKTVERWVIIPDVFLSELREKFNLTSWPRNYFVFGSNGEPGPDHLGKNNLRYRFNKIRTDLKMPNMYKFYSWKHTGNIAADEAGIPRREIQNQDGHASMITTENYLKNKKGFKSQNIKTNYPPLPRVEL